MLILLSNRVRMCFNELRSVLPWYHGRGVPAAGRQRGLRRLRHPRGVALQTPSYALCKVLA